MRLHVMVVATLALLSAPCAAQPFPAAEPSLTVQGEGRVDVPPDYAALTVEVETKSKTAADATTAHTARATRAMEALRDMKPAGVEVVRSNFRLGEIHTPAPPSRQPETEFQAVTTFELKMTKIDAVNDAITKIASSGLFRIGNLRFAMNADNPAVKEARKRAVTSAREKAQTYADAASVQLAAILKIEDSESHGPVMYAAKAAGPRSVQVVPPDNLTMTATVSITWRIVARP
jgi:uncharacterized protein YggE